MTHRRANSRTYSVLRVVCAWDGSNCSMTCPFQRIWPSASRVTCSMFWNQGLQSRLAPGIAVFSGSCRFVHRTRARRLVPARFIVEGAHRKPRTLPAKTRRNRTCTQCASAPRLPSILLLKRFLLLSQIEDAEAGTLVPRKGALVGARNLAMCSPSEDKFSGGTRIMHSLFFELRQQGGCVCCRVWVRNPRVTMAGSMLAAISKKILAEVFPRFMLRMKIVGQ